MFLDEKELDIQAGRGGNGVVLFRHEKYVPRGGPDGGDGGNGGSVVIVGKSNLHALTNLSRVSTIAAQPGDNGGHRKSTGKSGEDAIIEVPLGTVVDFTNSEGVPVHHELIEEGQTIRLAKGGNGGWGNWRFRSSIQQAPDRANPGQEGESFHITLTLKLIADIGLVGLPNAGKSTLLSVISAATPKIADYPFTTLEPQLGVATVQRGKETAHLVIADLPGLIEGASGGKGLGVRFLKHVERTKGILHCLDISVSPEELVRNYQIVRHELLEWSATLAEKKEVIALTKCELLSKEEQQERQKALKKVTKSPIFIISAATGEGVLTLLTSLL